MAVSQKIGLTSRVPKPFLLVAALGLWLIATPLTFGFASQSIAQSDFLCGIALIGLGAYGAWTRRLPALLAIVLVGLWLEFAPLALWAHDAISYLNDTLVGFVVLALALQSPLVQRPHAPSSSMPEGWSFNPSSWPHRISAVLLATLCWFLARYLTVYQLHYIPYPWDPFFGDGTLHVLTSSISQLFPVPDAGLGAFAYTLEALLGWQGDDRRWCTMPWAVFSFGILVVPVGIISTILIVLQPVVVGHWCTLCLFTAACMLLMVVLMAAEMVASLLFLIQAHKEGRSVWRLFWQGTDSGRAEQGVCKGFGISLPWNLLGLLLLGGWLLAAPKVLALQGHFATSDWAAGPLLIAISAISCAEVLRSLRLINLLVGLWLLLSPWLLGGPEGPFLINNVVSGAVALLLALRRGGVRGRYGPWQRCIF